jgi:excisionase family DNA binding protein
MSDLPKTYTVEEIQRILHYKSPESVRRLIKNGTIPAIRVGGKYLVTEETLQKILKGEISADEGHTP